MNKKIILASTSPRRKEILAGIGLEFEICGSSYEEDMTARSDPQELACFLALKKAEAVVPLCQDTVVIAADTFVVLDGKFLGKPKDNKEAKSMLQSISGKKVDIISGYAIIDTESGKKFNDFGWGSVFFREISESEIEDYIASGEPMDKAGAFGIQGRGAVFVEKIEGDWYSMLCMPIAKIYKDLKSLGVKLV